MYILPACFVRWIGADSPLDDLVNDAKALTWTEGAEFALLELMTGERALVKGGRDGIQFFVKDGNGGRSLHFEIEGQEVQVARIEWHTHPRVTGPSDGDLAALVILGQASSIIYELGGDPDGTRISPKPGLAAD